MLGNRDNKTEYSSNIQMKNAIRSHVSPQLYYFHSKGFIDLTQKAEIVIQKGYKSITSFHMPSIQKCTKYFVPNYSKSSTIPK